MFEETRNTHRYSDQQPHTPSPLAPFNMIPVRFPAHAQLLSIYHLYSPVKVLLEHGNSQLKTHGWLPISVRVEPTFPKHVHVPTILLCAPDFMV